MNNSLSLSWISDYLLSLLKAVEESATNKGFAWIMYDSGLTFLPWSQPIRKQKLLNIFILTVTGTDIFCHRYFKKCIWTLNFTSNVVSGKIFNYFSCNYTCFLFSSVIQFVCLFVCFTVRIKYFWYEIKSS